MSETHNPLARIFAACWKDDDLKARFMADPKSVLSEHGMDVPADVDVRIVENTGNCVYITMPAAPSAAVDLSDEELRNVAGGKISGDGGFLTDHSCCFC